MRRWISHQLLGILITCWAVLVFGAYQMSMTSRDAHLRAATPFRMRQLLMGLDQYYARNQSYPPNRVFVESAAGGDAVTQSWRALLLPTVTNPQVGEKYDLQRPWDDPQNLEAAKSIDAYSTFSGGSLTSVFLVNDAFRIKARIDDARSTGEILLLSVPNRSELWSTPSELTVAEVWNATNEKPKLTMVGLTNWDVIPLLEIASTEQEVADVLNYGSLTDEERTVYQARIAKWHKEHPRPVSSSRE